MICIKKIFLLICLLHISLAYGHVQLEYPDGGETFVVGSHVIIQWQESIGHGSANWDLYFSANGGGSWQPVATDLEHGLSSYNWLVPTQITDNGRIRIVQDNDNGADYESASNDFTITTATGIEEDTSFPEKTFVLHAAYPNPFNGQTTIAFTLKQNSTIEINIYNVLGKQVDQLIKDDYQAGKHHISWNPAGLPSGLYFYSIHSALSTETRRLVYIK